MKRNLAIIYATSALMWGRLFVPVMALFYIASQVSLENFTLIMGVFALTTLVLEIPSGIIADFLGKKKTLLIARACFIGEVALLAFTNGFWPLLLAQIIAAIGVSLSSGTNSSLLYDTLRRTYKEHRHMEIRGIQQTIIYISQGIFFIVGVWLFTINTKLPAKISLIPITLGFLLTFFLKEPYKPNKHVAIASIGRHLEESISYLRRHKYVRYIVFYAMPITATMTVALSLSSVYFEATHIPIKTIGLIAFIMSLVTAYGTKEAHNIEKQLGEKPALRIIPIALVIALFLLSFKLPLVGVIFFFLICYIQGFLLVILDNYVNKHLESSHRTTMLSIRNAFTSVALIVLFPLIGGIAGTKLGIAFLVLALILAGYMISFFFLFTRRHYLR